MIEHQLVHLTYYQLAVCVSLKTANDELENLPSDQHRHAIDYNHYFTECSQKNLNACYEKRIEVLKAMLLWTLVKCLHLCQRLQTG